METNNGFFSRKNPRWKGFDYSKHGAYFITFCTHDRKNLLSKIEFIESNDIEFSAKLTLTEIGETVKERLNHLETSFPGVHLDEYSIMPNHVHFIVFLDGTDPSVTISKIVGSVKSYVTKRTYGTDKHEKLFQRSFFDRVIRDYSELAEIRQYIINNPRQWAFDEYNAERQYC